LYDEFYKAHKEIETVMTSKNKSVNNADILKMVSNTGEKMK